MAENNDKTDSGAPLPPKLNIGSRLNPKVKRPAPNSTIRMNLNADLDDAEKTDPLNLDKSNLNTTIRIDIPEDAADTPASAEPVDKTADLTLDQSALNTTIRIDIPEEGTDIPSAGAAAPEAKSDDVVLDKSALNTTIRIDIPEEGADVPSAGAAAPEAKSDDVVLDKSALNTTIRLDIPESDAAEAPTIRIKKAASQDPKRMTSKIPLSAVMAGVEGDGSSAGPATIKLSPAKGGKRETSRISLEDALSSADSAGPKTIRLKKPSEAPTIKVKPAASPALNKTAHIDLPDKQEDVTPSQKKTIVVKRPGSKPTVKPGISLARAGKGANSSGAADSVSDAGPSISKMPEPAAAPAGIHWFFPVWGLISCFVMMFVVYMFLSQAIGPNMSLTQLSYKIDGPDLKVPGLNKLQKDK